jgi:hypothetical protein
MSADPSRFDFATMVSPDPADERDLVYVADAPAGHRPPTAVGYEDYRRYVGTTWHQRGQECTGFALAAIANYHRRRHRDDPTFASVSRRMLYEVAQMYDQETWEQGSTLRGALKGWSRTGVALDELWPYDPRDEDGSRHGSLTLARLLDARNRPLLWYRKIDGSDITTMQHALASGHPLYVSARLHVGWYRLFLPDIDPVIIRRPDDDDKGGHAFVIAGYDERGFWVHNSWGPEWGTEGYALLPYDEWLTAHQDVWVVDVDHAEPEAAASPPPSPSEVSAYRDMWQHLVVLRDDGTLSSSGLYEMDEKSLGTLLYLFQERTAEWPRRRLAIVADGGALPTALTIERYRSVRDRFLASDIYPLFVVWETAWWADLGDELHRWAARLPHDDTSGSSDRRVLDRSIADLLCDQLDRRSVAAVSEPSGGGRALVERVRYKRGQKPFDLHLVATGAGDLLMARLAPLLPAPLTTATTVASALTLETFTETYAQLVDAGSLQHVAVTVDSGAERVGPLRMSFLELASQVRGDPGEAGHRETAGTGGRRRLLGLADDVEHDDTIRRLRASGHLVLGVAPLVDHVDLLDDASVVGQVIDSMLSHRSDPPDGADSPGRSGVAPLPRDPLARAESLRDGR